MTWRGLTLAPSLTHHVRGVEPAYAARFERAQSFHEPGLAAVRDEYGAWFIGPDGRPAHGRRFQEAFGFYEGLAAVRDEDGWHHVDVDASDAYAGRFDWCGNFQGGRCTVRSSEVAYFHITSSGTPAYDARWRYVGDYRHGVAVAHADESCTHIDIAGELMHGRWFVDLDVFHKGFARARDASGWTHIDLSGRPVYARRFAAVEPFYNGQARVERLDGGLEVIDEGGKTLVVIRAPS